MFVWAFYIYNEHTFVPPFSTFSLSLLYYIYIRETLFPAPYLSRHFLTLSLFTLILFIIYSIYREEHTFPQLFTPFLILLLYSLYIEEGTLFPPPFLPSYKVNTFSTATFFIFLKCYLREKFAGKSF